MEFQTLYQELVNSTEMIRALTNGIDQEQAQVKPDAKSWSILEVVCHLYDEEREDFREHLDFILHRQNEEYHVIDPQSWVTERKYNEQNLIEMREKFFGEGVQNYIALRLAERGEYKFASGAKIWESVEWLPKLEDFENYLMNAEIGISAPVTKAINVSLVLQDTYKSVPAKGKLKNDLKLIAGVGYLF